MGEHRDRPEVEPAVGHPGRRCRVGDECDPFRSGGCDRDPDRVLVHVDAIVDQLAGNGIVGERGAGRAWIAVMEMPHPIEQVGRQASARTECGMRLVETRLGMADGGDRSCRDDVTYQVHAARQFRSECHHLDGAIAGVEQMP
jgi:hypothetical protein